MLALLPCLFIATRKFKHPALIAVMAFWFVFGFFLGVSPAFQSFVKYAGKTGILILVFIFIYERIRSRF